MPKNIYYRTLEKLNEFTMCSKDRPDIVNEHTLHFFGVFHIIDLSYIDAPEDNTGSSKSRRQVDGSSG